MSSIRKAKAEDLARIAEIEVYYRESGKNRNADSFEPAFCYFTDAAILLWMKSIFSLSFFSFTFIR